MIGKLNLVTVLAALVLFFFPWIEVQCSGKPAFQQSGFQAIRGDATPLGEFKEEYENSTTEKEGNAAVLPGISLFCILGALAFSIRSVMKDGGHEIPGALCLIAFGFLLLQAATEFPIREDPSLSVNLFPARGQNINEVINETARREITSNYLPAFYLELAALAVPSLVFANGVINRLRKQGAVV